MNDADKQWIVNIATLNARQHLDTSAQLQVLNEVLAELISEVSGRDVKEVLSSIRARVEQKQQKYLLGIEDQNPSLAAQMDKGRQPPPV